uniref:Transketolase-like pyrimidine-binding domain-containing protein n=1 Tax=Bionectria ochroleuca TaxID=29856 RepID=A0A0B7JN99_BIOOC
MAPSATTDLSVAAPKLADEVRLFAQEDDKTVDRFLREFRCLIADLVQHLWRYTMKFSPTNPSFFNRDRFVLSNGHTCLFQYAFLHLTGYEQMTMDQLKSYHSARYDSFAPGHPEIEHEGIEVTTGPLGQGVANAVGLAMATKSLAATYNRPGFDLVNNTTYVMIGDACPQEGVFQEAVDLAGHWKLNNLVMIYDNNQITCDGSVDMCSIEDLNARMRANGWNVIDVLDGNYDVEGIIKALQQAKASTEKPTFINVRTTIGIGSKVAGDAKAHGAAFGVDEVRNVKAKFGMNPDEHFVVSDEVYNIFADLKARGQKLEQDWNALVADYAKEYPELHKEFIARVEGRFTQDWRSIIPSKESFPTTPTPSRKSAGLVCNPLAAKLTNMMVGTADLSPSVNMAWKDKVDFQHPDLRTTAGINGTYQGRYIHWGIREHAMASISNGLAAYQKGTILPITSSFFMFYIYAAPGVRMGALQHLQQIHIATHDSIGTGEDGPTHQPIALPALYRAMPNILYIRPCDSEETAGAFMAFAVRTREVLADKFGIKARVVSFPCQRLFEAQPAEYKRETLRYRSNAPRVVIEAYAVNGWERYADAGYSMSTFGKSLPGKDAYEFFGFNGETIAPHVARLVEDVRRDGIESLRGEFRDLNTPPASH